MKERKLEDLQEGERIWFEIVNIKTGEVVQKGEIKIPKRKIERFYYFLLSRVNLENYFVRLVDYEGNIIVV
jgi:hypothetical protein